MSIACYGFITFHDLYSTGHDKKKFSFSFPAARRTRRISFPEPARPFPELQSSEAVGLRARNSVISSLRRPGHRASSRHDSAQLSRQAPARQTAAAAVCHDGCFASFSGAVAPAYTVFLPYSPALHSTFLPLELSRCRRS